jgi:succinate dehydrogenase / fumarate reductase membrane anchor subunit
MKLRTPLGRVRGLGSAKEGASHWWAQRVTALALVPLTVWFVASVVSLVGADHATVSAWLGSRWVAVTMVLLVGVTFHHAQLGLQVVVEDYVHSEWLKLTALMLVKAGSVVLGLVALFAVFKIAVGG